MSPERKAAACELVAREAQYLDEQRWDDWLDLYDEDAVFWVPTWKNETELVDDPTTGLSFIYLENRQYLRERVVRATSGRAVSSLPMPRTAHLVAGVLAVSQDGGDTVSVKSAFSSHVFMHKDNVLVPYAGRYEHVLRRDGDDYRIASKKIILANDYLVSQLDFFYI